MPTITLSPSLVLSPTLLLGSQVAEPSGELTHYGLPNRTNRPSVRLMPSATYVSWDYAFMIVQQLVQLQQHDSALFAIFHAWASDDAKPYLPPNDWHWLVRHSLMREDLTLEERVRDITRMCVTEVGGELVINPESIA